MTSKKEVEKTAKKLIIKPRLTEKGAILSDNGVYVFVVNPKANKSEIKKEIELEYKVTVLKVNIAKNPKKNVFIRGKKGIKPGVKKAYVYLKEGDKIEITA